MSGEDEDEEDLIETVQSAPDRAARPEPKDDDAKKEDEEKKD